MNRKKLAVGSTSAVAVLALIGGVAAQFTTSAVSPTQQIGTGTVALTLDNVDPTVWTDKISNLAAGDSVERFVDLRNSGTLDISGIVATQTNTLGALLTAPSDISVLFESCSVAWNTIDGTCSGTQAPMLANTSVREWAAQSKAADGFDLFAAGTSRHLKLTTSLAAEAPNQVQSTSGTITYTFTGTQRGGTGWDDTGAAVVKAPTNVSTEVVGSTIEVGFDGSTPGATYVIGWNIVGDFTSAQEVRVPADVWRHAIAIEPGKDYDVTVTAVKDNASVTSVPVRVTTQQGTGWEMADSMSSAASGANAVNARDGKAYILGGGDERSNARTAVDTYDLSTGARSSSAPLPGGWFTASVVTSQDGMAYAVGGQEPWRHLTDFQRYNPLTNTWTTLAPMSGDRVSAATISDPAGNVYVISGSDYIPDSANESRDSDKNERYNAATNTWTMLAPIPLPVMDATILMDDAGDIYVMGGYSIGADQVRDTVQKYSPATNTWTALAPMKAARSDAAAAIDAEGNFVVVGGTDGAPSGFQGTKTTQKYNVSTNTWTLGPDLNIARQRSSALASSDGKIYVFAGIGTNWTWLASVERLG